MVPSGETYCVANFLEVTKEPMTALGTRKTVDRRGALKVNEA